MSLAAKITRLLDKREQLTKEQLRRARPQRNPSVETEDLEDGGAVLSAPLDIKGPRLMAAVAKKMKAPDRRKIELEPVGASVWRLCDGKHTFEAISKDLRSQYKMGRLEADASLEAFLQMLSRRGLVAMMVGKK